MNFLSGEYRSLLHIFRSVALGLVALLLAHTNTNAQCVGPTGTVTFKAGDFTSCFLDEDSVYSVQISAANFYNLDSINLFLDYNEADWVFDGFTILEDDVFNQTTNGNVPLSIDDDGDELNIHWDEKDVRGWLDNSGAYIPFLEIRFRTTGAPGSYTNALAWDETASKVYVCGGTGTPTPPYQEFTSVSYDDGLIEATIAYPVITYTVTPEEPICASTPVLVTVLDPVGDDLMYSFNGLTWTDNNVANATAGNNTVQVLNTATGCISVVQNIVIDAPDEVAWETEITDESCDRQGEIQFNITTPSTAPYTYWVVPASDIVYVQFTILTEGEDAEDLLIYKSPTNQVLRAAGDYYVAVQDANGCVSLLDTDNWEMVTIDGSSVVDATIEDTYNPVTCAGGNDGVIAISAVTGGEVGSAGYEVWVDGVMDGYYTSGDYYISGLTPDTYTIEVMDTVGCTYSEDITIDDVAPWTFEVEYLDAPCADATGELWISAIYDGEGDPVDISTLGSDVTFKVVGGTALIPVDTTILAADTLKGIPAANYSAWIQDTVNGCAAVAYDNPDNSGNTIPILDDGAITFTATVTGETCYGEEDGTVTISDVTRTCENCNEGAVYEYMIADTGTIASVTDWMDIDSVYSELAPDAYWVIVRDAAKTDSVCATYEMIDVSGADAPLTMVIDSAYAPTCHGGNDGYVKMYVSGGTPPYMYSVDNAPNWRENPPFGLTEGEHILQVRDANMCIIADTITVDSIPAIMIEASIDSISCPGEGAPISIDTLVFGRFTDTASYTFFYAEDEDDVFTAGTAFEPAWATTPTEVQPGTYYVGAMDVFGCTSNVVEIELAPVEEMEVEVTWEDAMCYGTWSGRVNIEVLSGTPDSVFYYAFANNAQVLDAKYDSLLAWYPFTLDSVTESVEMQKGNYYFVVKGSCDQYSNVAYAPVGGYDPINVDPIDSITPVTCYGGNNGTMVITDEVTGGAPGYGIEGAMYLYTLYDADDNVVGEEMQELGAWDTLSAGAYTLYVYDNTDLEAVPTMCPPDSVNFTVKEYPQLLIDSINVYDVNCAGQNNGELHVFISGGLGGISTLTGPNSPKEQPDGNAYTVTVNEITGDQGYSLKLGDAIDTVVFQTQGGDFEVAVMDANGCIVKDTVTVEEPAAWNIVEMITEPSDCGENDGVIKGIVVGGFAGVPIQVTVGDSIFADLYMSGDTVTFVDSAEYLINYTVTLVNDSASVVDSGLVLVDDQCEYSESYVIEVINPFDFVAEAECTKCYGTSSGTVMISDITGGSGAYQFQLVNVLDDDYDAADESRWWPKDAEGDNLYVTDSVAFDTMAAGEYKIYLRDDAGFSLAKCCRPHRIVVCETDSLELVEVKLVAGVTCEGDSTGAISIEADGGTAPYMYAYTRTELGDNGYPYVGLPDPDSLTWYENDTITGLPVGTYIGWVMDANGCMTGCEINSQGLPVDRHRVVIMDEGSVSVDSIYVDEAMCYGGYATIELYGVTAGTSSSYLNFVLEGVNYLGDSVTYVFDSVPAGMTDYELDSVVAPMDTIPYKLSVQTDLECEAEGMDIMFGQPDVYAVHADIVGDGICVGEQQAVIILSTEGGTAPFSYTIYADGEFYAGPTVNVNHVVPIGPMYTVISEDALGCEAVDTLDLATPVAVSFSVENATCYADTLASALVTAQGTPGRQFKAMWDEFEGDVVVASGESEWFDEYVRLDQVFTYDDTNVNDVHFEITVIDDNNCTAGIDTITFDKVDGPLQVVNVEGLDDEECVKEVSFEVAGGTAPYAVEVDGEVVTDSIWFYETITLDLAGGEHEVVVLDAHGCFLVDTIVVEYSAEITDYAEYYEGDTLYYSNATAGIVDTMLTEGTYIFIYDVDTACSGKLTVEVVEVERVPLAVVSMEPTAGDTIADNHPVFVITFDNGISLEDAGSVYVLAEDSTVVLEIPITEAMFSDSTLTVDYDWETVGTLDLNTTYTVLVDSGVVMGQGMTWEGVMDDSWTFTTGDSVKTYDPLIPTETIDFNVYPNPFNDFIRIDNSEKLSRVIVSNIAGQRVLDIVNPTYEIRTGTLVTGVYVVTLISDGEIVKSERIIKR